MQQITRRLEPNWRPIKQLSAYEREHPVASWLFEQHSMTTRLRKHANGRLRVNVIKHQWDKPRHSERQLLDLAKHCPTIVREIELLTDNQVMVYARSVYPATSLKGSNYTLRHLAGRPVGDVMYHDPTLARSQPEVAELKPGHTDFHAAISSLNEPPISLWGRRMIFHVNNQPILISEIFLPTLFSKE